MAKASRKKNKAQTEPQNLLPFGNSDPARTIPFIKAHGLGNDFVIIDARDEPVSLSKSAIRDIADRRKGVGCDQLIVMEPPSAEEAHVFMRIYNADGGEVGACGNATRCVAWLILQEEESESCVVETFTGTLTCERAGDYAVRVNMGAPRLDWEEIPLAEECDTLFIPLNEGSSPAMDDAAAVSMGNPHAVFFVKDIMAVSLEKVGPTLEYAPLFPEQANISVVEIISTHRIRMRTWERGAGITPACGTAACAALVASVRRGLTEREAEVEVPGGTLTIRWDRTSRIKVDEDEDEVPASADGDVWMTGPVQFSFAGQLPGDLIEEA